MNTLSLDELIAPNAPRFHIMRSHHTGNSRHAHSFFELVYVTEGYCIHTRGDLSALLTEGDVFVLPPGAAHSYSGNRVTHIYNCLFETSFLGDAVNGLAMLPGLGPLFSGEDIPVAEIHLPLAERKIFLKTLDEMYAEYTSDSPGREIWLRGQLMCLLTQYARASRAPHAEPGYAAYVREALGVICERYSDPALTVHDIASSMNVSDDHFTRRFRAVLGVTPREYLRRYRFARAMELLSGGMSVRGVAEASGFSRLSYFSREFTKELGITPTEYKKSQEVSLWL